VFLASLNNDEHAWELRSRAYFFIPGTPSQTNITYQVVSEVLDLQLVIQTRLEDEVLQEIVVYVDGNTLTSVDTNIHDKLELMASDQRSSIKSAFSASIKKVFAPSTSLQATSTVAAVGTVTINVGS
jgi:hypothetical protein